MNTADDNDCTLYEAVEAASTNQAGNGCTTGTDGLDTIQFNITTTPMLITLNNGALTTPVDEPLIVDGPGSSTPGLTIDDGSAGRIFDAGDDLTLSELTLENVNATSQNGGAVLGADTVTLTNTTVDANHLNTSGQGACVYAPTISVSDSSFFNNSSAGAGGCLAGG